MRRQDQNENKGRKNGRFHIYDTQVTKQSTKIMLRHYNNFMVTTARGKNFKNYLLLSIVGYI